MKTLVRVGLIAVIAVSMTPAEAQRTLLKKFEDEFVSLSEELSPSVVEIATTSSRPHRNSSRLDEMFRFFGLPRPDGEEEEPEPDPEPRSFPSATGTGFFIDAQGHIVTNNHVVENTDSITVLMSNGDELEAVLVGEDPGADIAVIKVDPTGHDIRPMRLGDSDGVKVGQFAIAVGSARGQTGSVSYGHISGLGRENLDLPEQLRFQSFIQTDAAINLGNSGGPLCNIDGEVVGVNVAIVYDANSIGFAIPINRVKKIVPQLISDGSVTRGWLGVQIQDIETVARVDGVDLLDFIEANMLSDDEGSYVRSVTKDGPAEHAGLQGDDVIVRINDHKILSTTDLINYVSDLAPGDPATIDIVRKGERVQLDIVVGRFPGLLVAKYGKPYLGMHVEDLELTEEMLERLEMEEQPSDFYIVEVVEGSPADEAGVMSQDIVLEVAHQEVKSLEEFKQTLVEKVRSGKTLLLRVQQPGAEARKVYVKVPEDYDESQ